MRTSDHEYRFSALCGHLGAGNPKGGIWIIGIEEGSVWESASEIDEFVRVRQGIAYDCRDPDDSEVRTWRISTSVSKICAGVTGYLGTWEEFRQQRYLTRDCSFYMTNLFPLAKPRAASMPGQYRDWFGIHDVSDYLSRVSASGRWEQLLALRSRSKPAVTICHGKGAWPDYRRFLELVNPLEVSTDRHIEVYSGGVILTPHLSWSVHMPSSRIDEVIRIATPFWTTRS